MDGFEKGRVEELNPTLILSSSLDCHVNSGWAYPDGCLSCLDCNALTNWLALWRHHHCVFSLSVCVCALQDVPDNAFKIQAPLFFL